MVVQVNGYTDNAVNNNPGRNEQLSIDRANAVLFALEADGVPATQLRANGFGEDNPLAPNDTDAGPALNRRVEIIANHWTPLTDAFSSLEIGSIAISPLDASGNPVTAATSLNAFVIYAGTGNFSSNRQDGAAAGLLKSTDGGTNWSLLATSDLEHRNITSVIPTGLTSGGKEVVLVSATSVGGSKPGGIFRSTDGGASFTSVVAGNITSLVADPGKSGRFYAGVIGQGVEISDDSAGATWSLMASQPNNITATGGASGATAERIVLSVQADPANAANVVFAALEKGGTVTGVFKFPNQSAMPWTQFGPVPQTNGQADLDMSLRASQDGTQVFLGGAAHLPAPFVGNLFVVDGASWNPIVLAGANGTAPHADSRALTFDSAGRLVDADDGGIYRLSLPFDATNRPWTSVNGDMAITEILSLAYDPLNNAFLSGNQDTGSSVQASQPTDPVDINGDGLPDDFATRSAWQQVPDMQGDGQRQLVVPVDATHVLRFSMANNFQFFRANEFDNNGNPFFVTVTDGGSGYTSAPTVTFSDPPAGCRTFSPSSTSSPTCRPPAPPPSPVWPCWARPSSALSWACR